jgi:hypothetical protein
MKSGDAVEVQLILAGGRDLMTRWSNGYEFARAEANGCVIVKHTRGTFENCEVRYHASDVRQVKT